MGLAISKCLLDAESEPLPATQPGMSDLEDGALVVPVVEYSADGDADSSMIPTAVVVDEVQRPSRRKMSVPPSPMLRTTVDRTKLIPIILVLLVVIAGCIQPPWATKAGSGAKLSGMVGIFYLFVAPALIIVSALFRKTSDRVKHEMRLAPVLAAIKKYRSKRKEILHKRVHTTAGDPMGVGETTWNQTPIEEGMRILDTLEVP